MKKLLLLILGAFPVFGYAQSDSVLILSDVHVNLALKCKNFYHTDTDTTLFLSAIKNVKPGKYPFIIMPGDLLKHNGHSKEVMDKTFAYIIKNVQRIDKDAIILPALGNNDCIAHNTPNKETYDTFYKTLLEPIDQHKKIARTFYKGGYYAYEKDDLSIIVLNTVLFMCENKNLASAARAELRWLENKLSTLKPNQSVWLVYHVPPGIDRFSKTPSWQDSIQVTYAHIIEKYASLIKFQLAGHTHMIDAKLMINNGKLFSTVVIAPGLDSRNSNNPAYQVMHFNKHDKKVNEINTYYTDSLSNYQWHAFTFKDLGFKFLLDCDNESGKGTQFVERYTIYRGATRSEDGADIAWDEDFCAISAIKIPY
ncbi:MAG: hypothetical protein JWQ57_3703 [Mucilaginibacter sp.]|nr:hypothetical protein [Mucilaginibacter sp.]